MSSGGTVLQGLYRHQQCALPRQARQLLLLSVLFGVLSVLLTVRSYRCGFCSIYELGLVTPRRVKPLRLLAMLRPDDPLVLMPFVE